MTGVRYDRTKRQDQRLIGFECQSCGYVSFPEEKRICKRCGETPAEFEQVQLRERGEIQTFVVQQRLPGEFETPQPVAIVDLPQVGDGEAARVYGLLTETSLEELEIGATVEARFRELFTDGDRPIHSFKFAIPREEKSVPGGDDE
jgi:uncharacterized OB-fold protein